MMMSESIEAVLASARNGNPEAQFQLACYYDQYDNEYSAFLWSHVGADNGHKQAAELAKTIMASGLLPDEDLALANLELGCWYHLGKNVPSSPERSATYVALAEQQGILDSFDLEELREALDLPFLLDWKELFPNHLR